MASVYGFAFDQDVPDYHLVVRYDFGRRSAVSDGVTVRNGGRRASQSIFRESAIEENGPASRAVLLDPLMGDECPSIALSPTAERYLNSVHRRTLEVIICLGLLLVLLPFLFIIGIAVRISSGGPSLFRQLRYGRNMVMFELLKFRSMYSHTVTDPFIRQATPGDPRITPLGKFLRRTSLDELPQLLNVMRGEMSLIGPRPHAIQHDVHYRKLIPNYCTRFRARPGLTGLAQVSGARGGTPLVEDMERRIKLDLMYLQNASLALDCKILFKTIKEVVKSDVAY